MLTKLRELRNNKRYSTYYMAQNLGISKAYYSQIETSKRRLSYDMAIKIAQIFKTTPDKIFYDDFKKSA